MTDSIRGMGGVGPIDPNRPIDPRVLQQLIAYINASSSIDDLEETIQVIEGVMRNLSNYAVKEAAAGESYLREQNPFFTAIIKEIEDLRKLGEYLLDLFPEDSYEAKQIIKELALLRFGTEGPKLENLENIPKVARTFMELSDKIPAGPGIPGDREDIIRSYQKRFWTKMMTLFENVGKSWELSFEKALAKRTELGNLYTRFKTISETLKNLLNVPLNKSNIGQLATALKELNSLDWSHLPAGSKDRFLQMLFGIKGPNIGGNEATIKELVTGRFISDALQEWLTANPKTPIASLLGQTNAFPGYANLLKFIQDRLGPLKESGMYDERLGTLLLTSLNILSPTDFPITLSSIPINLPQPRQGIPLTLTMPGVSDQPFLYLVPISEVINSPRFEEAFTLNMRNVDLLTQEVAQLYRLYQQQNTFIEKYEALPAEIQGAHRAAESAFIALGSPRDQIRLLMARVNQAVIDSIGNRPTITPEDGFYDLIATQVTHMREIGLYLIKELPQGVDRQKILDAVNHLQALEDLALADPPQPLPMEGLGGVKSLPQMAILFIAESMNLAQMPGWPDRETPSGIRQFRFWTLFAEMFTELETFPESILKNATEKLEEIERTQRALLDINPIMDDLQTKVIDQLAQGASLGTVRGVPPRSILDDLEDIFQRLDALDVENLPKEVLDPLNALLFGEVDKETKIRSPGLIDLQGPPGPDGKPSTFPDMLMSAIILREMTNWFHNNNMPIPPVPPPPQDRPFPIDYKTFYMTNALERVGIINDPTNGLTNTIATHFLNNWPGYEDKNLFSKFIDRTRIAEMLEFPVTADAYKGVPLILPGIFAPKGAEGSGTKIGQLLPISRYIDLSTPRTPFAFEFAPFRFPPYTVGYVFAPSSPDFFKEEDFKAALSVTNKDLAALLSKQIGRFPRADSLDDAFKEQERIIATINNSGIIDDLKRAGELSQKLADTALMNSSLPDILRTVLLDVVMPQQEAKLEQYGQNLYFLNTAVKIYNTISTSTTDFANAPTNYNLSSQINRRFPHQGDPPHDYFVGEAKNARTLLDAQMTTTVANLKTVNQQITAIDKAIESVEKEYHDGNITADQMKDLTGNLRALQQHFQHARTDLGEMQTYLASIRIEPGETGGKPSFTLVAPGIPDPTNPNPPPMKNQDVLDHLSKVEQVVINGRPNPDGDDPPSLGGLKTIDDQIRRDHQNYGSTTDQAQLELQNAMTRIQQMWTIVATVLQLLNQIYMSLARSVKGQ